MNFRSFHKGCEFIAIKSFESKQRNLGAGQKVGEYTDFSFLAPKNFDAFIEKIKTLQLSLKSPCDISVLWKRGIIVSI